MKHRSEELNYLLQHADFVSSGFSATRSKFLSATSRSDVGRRDHPAVKATAPAYHTLCVKTVEEHVLRQVNTCCTATPFTRYPKARNPHRTQQPTTAQRGLFLCLLVSKCSVGTESCNRSDEARILPKKTLRNVKGKQFLYET